MKAKYRKKIREASSRVNSRDFSVFIASLASNGLLKKAELTEDWHELPANALVFISNRKYKENELYKILEDVKNKKDNPEFQDIDNNRFDIGKIMDLYNESKKYNFRAYDSKKNLMFGLDSMDLDRIWEAINNLKSVERKYANGIEFFYEMPNGMKNITQNFAHTENEMKNVDK
jgi:DNA repair ATPase RecN